MKNYIIPLIIILLSIFFLYPSLIQKPDNNNQKLAVLWTSGDPDVANKVCFMYTHAAKTAGWFDEVMLIVWGPSALLLSEDSELQKKIKKMKDDGIILKACITCADSYQVSDKLRQIGIEVIPMGKPLTEIIKSDWHLITF